MTSQSIVRDFHGCVLKEALDEVTSMISDARMTRKPTHVKLITGHGVIRESVFALLESYDLEPSYQLGNKGTIICVLE